MVRVTIVYKEIMKTGTTEVTTNRLFADPYMALGFLSSLSNMVVSDKDLVLIKTDVEVINE